jgi:hypothetical protein
MVKKDATSLLILFWVNFFFDEIKKIEETIEVMFF